MVLTGAFLFGFNGSMSKVVMEAGITPEQLTFFRVVGTAVLAGSLQAIIDPASLKVTWRELRTYAVVGVAGLAMVQWLYSVAISLLPVGVALLFEYTAVVLIALWARFVLKEQVHPRLWWAITAVLVGLAVVAQVWNSSLALLGVLAGLGAAVAYAIYFLTGERSVASRSPLAVAFWVAFFASMFWAVFSRWWELSPTALTEPVSLGGALDHMTAPMWLPVLGIVVLGGFAPFTLIFMSLRHISATTSGILASSEVMFAFAVAWLWLGESLTPVQLVGSAVVVTGIVFAQTARRPAPQAHSHTPFATGVPPEAP